MNDKHTATTVETDLLIKLSRMVTVLQCLAEGDEETGIDPHEASPQEVAQQILAWADMNDVEEDFLFEYQGMTLEDRIRHAMEDRS